MQPSSASITACRLSACLYIGSLLVAGGVALVGFSAFLIDLAVQLSRSTLTAFAF